MKPQPIHTPTLGESLDHYGEEYCTRAVNVHDELLAQLKKAVECLPGLNEFDLRPMKQAIAKAEAR